MDIERGTLYAIVDPSRCIGADAANRADAVEQMTRAVLRGGAGVVQLRDKDANSRQIFHLARHLADICAEFDVPFIVNDRLDIALAADADGVHVGPGDIPVGAIRQMVDDEFIVGGSAGTSAAAAELEEQGADYLGVGAIYEARSSKPDASLPRGPETIRTVVDTVDIPVVGIGGIDYTNAAAVVDHGAAGVAVITALTDAGDPEQAAAELCAVISE